MNTNFKFNDKEISYNITNDGYDIYLDGELWIGQHGDLGKPIDSTKSYEENCLAQIEGLCKPPEPVVDMVDSSNTSNNISTDKSSSLDNQLKELKENQIVLMEAVATSTETLTGLQDTQLALMEAVASIYESDAGNE